MARTNVPVTALVANGTVTNDPAGTTLDPTNGHIVGPRVQAEQIAIRVNNTAVSTKTVTLKKSTVDANVAGGQGDNVMTIPASTVAWLGPFESNRYSQPRNDTGTTAGGFLYLDVQAGATGTITVFNIPRNA